MQPFIITITEDDIRGIASEYDNPDEAYAVFEKILDAEGQDFVNAAHRSIVSGLRHAFMMASMPKSIEDVLKLLIGRDDLDVSVISLKPDDLLNLHEEVAQKESN